MVIIPPRNYVIQNPVIRSENGTPLKNEHGNYKIRHGVTPLFPGEVLYGKVTPLQVGYCISNGYQVCEDRVTKEECTANSPLSSTDDTCDGIDDNCDGAVDEGFEGTTVTCGLGECINTVLLHNVLEELLKIINCVPLSAPATIDNTCDGLDNDCDGSVDEDYVKETISCGVGACKRYGEDFVCTPGD